jgi:hypothetical protein
VFFRCISGQALLHYLLVRMDSSPCQVWRSDLQMILIYQQQTLASHAYTSHCTVVVQCSVTNCYLPSRPRTLALYEPLSYVLYIYRHCVNWKDGPYCLLPYLQELVDPYHTSHDAVYWPSSCGVASNVWVSSEVLSENLAVRKGLYQCTGWTLEFVNKATKWYSIKENYHHSKDM